MGEIFLNEGWLAELSEKGATLPITVYVNLVLQYEVADLPNGKERFFIEYRDGQIKDAQLGKHTAPDIFIEMKASTVDMILSGQISVEVAYMQGRLKIQGDYKRFLIDLREWRSSEAYVAMWAGMADFTA